MQKKILGLDLSLTATGWATWNGRVDWGTLEPGKRTDLVRLDWIRSEIAGLLTDDVALVVMEDFSYGSKGAAVFQIAGLGYLIRFTLWKLNVPFILVSPAALKKFVVGRAGSAKDPVKKDLVIREIWRRFDLEVNDNNAADACGLAFVGAALLGLWTPTMDPQRAVLAEVRKKFSRAIETAAALKLEENF